MKRAGLSRSCWVGSGNCQRWAKVAPRHRPNPALYPLSFRTSVIHRIHPRPLLALPGDNTHHAFSRGDTHHASKNTKRVIHLPSRSANEIAPKHSQHPLILPILTTFSLHAAATVSLSVLASVATSCFRACPSYCCRPYRRPDFERHNVQHLD